MSGSEWGITHEGMKGRDGGAMNSLLGDLGVLGEREFGRGGTVTRYVMAEGYDATKT